jgi:hypothetical protein
LIDRYGVKWHKNTPLPSCGLVKLENVDLRQLRKRNVVVSGEMRRVLAGVGLEWWRV